MLVIESSRAWRKGVRTHVVVEQHSPLPHLQTQGAYFNETFSMASDLPGYPVPLRQALTPLYAHKQFSQTVNGTTQPTYKWMLLGGEDTVWSVGGALALLHEMNVTHEQPYMISDHLTVKQRDGSPTSLSADPRCEPCPPERRTCPCRLRPACHLRGPRHHRPEDFANPDPACVVWFQGGSGLILSSAMLGALAADPHLLYHAALSGLAGAGAGDLVISEAARVAGFGFTAPAPPPSPTPPGNASEPSTAASAPASVFASAPRRRFGGLRLHTTGGSRWQIGAGSGAVEDFMARLTADLAGGPLAPGGGSSGSPGSTAGGAGGSAGGAGARVVSVRASVGAHGSKRTDAVQQLSIYSRIAAAVGLRPRADSWRR